MNLKPKPMRSSQSLVFREPLWLDVVFGGYNPTGRLPIQMPKDMDAVEEQSEDRALDMETYIDSEGHNYDYGYGMNYEGVLPAWKK